jgi:hypothetical protein
MTPKVPGFRPDPNVIDGGPGTYHNEEHIPRIYAIASGIDRAGAPENAPRYVRLLGMQLKNFQ